VGDPGGHFAERPHLARLDQLRILFDHRRDIGGGEHDRRSALVGDRARVQVHVKGRVAFLVVQRLGVGDEPGRFGLVLEGLKVLPRVLGGELREGLADQLGGRVAVDLDRAGVGVDDLEALRVDDEDGVRPAVEEIGRAHV